MRIIEFTRANEYKKYDELKVERNFILFKTYTTYRRINNHIFRYKRHNMYYDLGSIENILISRLFELDELEGMPTQCEYCGAWHHIN